MTSAPAIGFEYRPSRWLGRVLVAVAAIAVFAVWLSALPWPIDILLDAAMAGALWHTLRRWSATPVQAVGWGRDGLWSLRTSGGEDAAATLATFRVIGEQAVWLRLAVPGRRAVALLLAPDNSDADIRRRLRMRLALWEASGTLAAERGPTV